MFNLNEPFNSTQCQVLKNQKREAFLFLRFWVLFVGCWVLLLGFFSFSYAFEIKDTNAKLENNDIVLEPAKIEVFVDPGSSATKILRITNRTEKLKKFSIDIEDFTGSKDISKTVILLGNERGPYSLRDYFTPETREFVLKSKQQISLPITITIPSDAEPGGLFGSILISAVNVEQGSTGASGAAIVPRLGALFFVRVNGDANEDGYLEKFSIVNSQGKEKLFYQEDEKLGFELLFRNNGNVHLSPYGFITVSNVAGTEIGKTQILPFFAMPDSLRYVKIDWQKNVVFGRYKATVSLNRGYVDSNGDSLVDEQSVTFWVIPWKILLMIFGGIFLIVILVKLVLSKFEFKRKK